MSATTESMPNPIEELFRCATRETADRMTIWTAGSISLRLEGLTETELHEISDHLGPIDRMATMVLLEAEGEIGGTLVLLFDDDSLDAFLVAMTGEPVLPGERTPLQESALLETGNILASAFTGAISDATVLLVLPTPPILLTDYVASVLEQACMAQAINNEKLVLTRTRFERNGEALDWQLVFIPDGAMRDWIDSGPRLRDGAL
ncbi:MAG TPA: hypothetical protein DCQ98_03615 [Planctomycetaceae bacterium]|nr:hypothetical protein [Planctomycetaceae bacterium]